MNRRFKLGSVGLTSGLFSLLAVLAVAQGPAWWLSRNVVNENPADDYGVVNQGQLKHMASACIVEMNAKLDGGAGTALNALVAGWQNPGPTTDDYLVINLGQLKTVAKPIYDRLNEVHNTTGYPWTGIQSDDYACANLGQLKNVFNLSIVSGGPGGTDPNLSQSDYDQDGLPYWFEVLIGTDPTKADSDNDGVPDDLEDHDNDGISNLAEYLAGSSGSSGTDTDGDGLSDDEETALGTSITAGDSDGDGTSDTNEQALGTDPTDGSSNPKINLHITTPFR